VVLNERLGRLWNALDEDRRAFVTQILRYGIAGVGVTLFQIGAYNLLLGAGHLAPLIALIVSTALAMALGYIIHSRFSFGGHGSRDNIARTGGRFVAANLMGLSINSLWVWLFTAIMHWSPHLASLPMVFLTPVALFWLNRRWVFE
jgi:putative flippase GtrA